MSIPRKRVLRKFKTTPLPDRSEPTCKICLETAEEGDLISPCRCTGSVSHVHEECLKTWVKAKKESIEQAKCEICDTQFLMTWETSVQCILHQLFTRNCGKCITVPFLLFLKVCLVIFFLHCLGALERSRTMKSQILVFVLISLAFLAFLSLIAMSILAIKHFYIEKTIKKWEIYNYKQLEENTEALDEKSHSRKSIGAKMTEMI